MQLRGRPLSTRRVPGGGLTAVAIALQGGGLRRRASRGESLEALLSFAALPIRAVLVEKLALSTINHFW
jgi:hypothetical protein